MSSQRNARFFKERSVARAVLAEKQGKANQNPVIGCDTRWGSWLACLQWNAKNIRAMEASLLDVRVREAYRSGPAREKYKEVCKFVISHDDCNQNQLDSLCTLLNPVVVGIFYLEGHRPLMAAVYP